MPSTQSSSRNEYLVSTSSNFENKQELDFSRSALFYMKTRVCLNILWMIVRLPTTKLLKFLLGCGNVFALFENTQLTDNSLQLHSFASFAIYPKSISYSTPKYWNYATEWHFIHILLQQITRDLKSPLSLTNQAYSHSLMCYWCSKLIYFFWRSANDCF